MSKYATDLVKYTPTAQDKIPAEYADRIFTRTVSVTSKPFLQYWLMDEDGRNCFASGDSVRAMLFSAERRVELDSSTPDLFCSDLKGYTFAKRNSASGPFVEHLCLSPGGEIMGTGITRDSASEMAIRMHCARVSPDEISLSTFKRAAFPIPMRTSGKDGYLLDGDLGGMDELRKAVSIVWEFNPSLHGSVPVPEGRKWSEKEAFVRKRVSEIIRTDVVQNSSNGLLSADLSLAPHDGGSLTLVFFDAARMSKEQALKICYHQKLLEGANTPTAPAERQRA